MFNTTFFPRRSPQFSWSLDAKIYSEKPNYSDQQNLRAPNHSVPPNDHSVFPSLNLLNKLILSRSPHFVDFANLVSQCICALDCKASSNIEHFKFFSFINRQYSHLAFRLRLRENVHIRVSQESHTSYLVSMEHIVCVRRSKKRIPQTITNFVCQNLELKP